VNLASATLARCARMSSEAPSNRADAGRYPDWHLAQLNVARAVAAYDSPELASFMDRLEDINALGESAGGFVWRLKNDDGNTIGIGAHPDPLVVFNLSVWESVDDLYDFAYHSGHMDVFRRRKEWFGPFGAASMAMWWLPAGELPAMDEALRRLTLVDEIGPTPEAFTFRSRFPPPTSTNGAG
jgi:hypothetical protein